MINLLLCICFMFCLTLLGIKIATKTVKWFWKHAFFIVCMLGIILYCLAKG